MSLSSVWPRCPGMRGDWLNWLGFGWGGGVLIGWHCAKVQGHAELEIEKPRVKPLSYDFPKLHHSKTKSFCANVHLRQSFWKTVKVTKRSCDVTPRSKYQQSKGHPWSPVPRIWCNSDYYLQSYGILKKMAHVIFLWLGAILKVSVEPYRFSNIP